MHWDFRILKEKNPDMGELPFLYTWLLTLAVYIMVMDLFPYGFFACVFKNKNVSSSGQRLSDVFCFQETNS